MQLKIKNINSIKNLKLRSTNSEKIKEVDLDLSDLFEKNGKIYYKKLVKTPEKRKKKINLSKMKIKKFKELLTNDTINNNNPTLIIDTIYTN